MAGFELTNKAKSDLKEIAIYTQNRGASDNETVISTCLIKRFTLWQPII